MKKAILCVAALLIGAVSFAQVAGAPTSQVVTALPSAATTANAGESIQNGNNHKVQVRQAGTNQSVYTEQNDGSTVAGGNLAAVYQTGDVNPPSGVENAAEVLQSGEANESTSIQQGDKNNAYTAQGQIDDASSGNKARIQQGNNEQAEENYAAIEQDGTGNQAQTLQRWDNNDAYTLQSGVENKSMIDQAAAPDGSDGQEAFSAQLGTNNQAAIDQSGAGGRNNASVRQWGTDNQSKQTQTTTAVAGMTGNHGYVQQGAGSGLPLNPSNTAYTTIFTEIQDNINGIDAPLAFINQESFGAKSKQIQNGKMNEAGVWQTGGSADGINYVEQVQDWGWNNDAATLQTQVGVGDNYAKQYQGGDNNLANALQYGNGHKSLQDQRGHRNSGLASQHGSGNLLNQHQRGNDNAATSVQHGLANATLIVQRDGQSYVSSQNAGLGPNDLSAGGNQIDIYQGGPADDFSSLIDCGFEAPMNLDMDYTVPDLTIGDICPDC